MPELEPALADVYAAYVAQLGATLDGLAPWWANLERAASTQGRAALRLRWPAGVASHPRVLGLVRDFHQRFDVAQRSTGPAPRFDDEAAWGSGFEPAPRVRIPPRRLLIDRLQVEAPHLHLRMSPLLVMPVGTPPEPTPSFRTLEPLAVVKRELRALAVEHRHGVARGVERLLGAAADLRSPTSRARRVPLHEASEFHRLAFAGYLRALERALGEAEDAWLRERDAHERRGLAREDAVARMFVDHPCGLVDHPAPIGVIQAYWALARDIDAKLPPERSVAPEQLLLGWLIDEGKDTPIETWVEALTALPYWPLVLDDQAREGERS
jgi:hypothetical protein